MLLKEVYSHGLKRKYEVEVPASDIDAGFKEAIEDRIKKNVYRGFRKGKTPFDVVAKQEEGLIDSVIVDQVYRHWYDIKQNEKLVLFNNQEEITGIDATAYKESKAAVKFTVECELLPQIPKIDFSQVSVKTKSFEVSEKDIEKYKQKVKEQLVDWVDLAQSDSIESGDRVVVDLRGKVGDEAFRGGQLDNFECQVGDGKVIAPLSDGLIGMKVGEERLIPVLFPEDYHDIAVAGKNAVFHTLVKSGKRSQKVSDPEAALLKRLSCKTDDETNEKVKSLLNLECSKRINELLRRQIEAQLEKYDFQVPESLLERQERYVKVDLPSISADDLKKEAMRRTRLSLILAEFAAERNISIDKTDVARHLLNVSMAAGLDSSYLAEIYRNNKDFAGSVTLKLMESKIFAALLETVQKEAEASSVDEILGCTEEKVGTQV
ncbi:trigger factor [Neorickettsia sennetsu]|uniref:Trigger factor n=1 Tax=Ehrlichia sennetsu (strain ATCC VR-367 / Miyayama) TaxID=222891 RepID=Q2GD20_EHRS3|nr:trigger factor [Neorickettsia sennetsu]ABD45851.1 putative trigger factor [Neorickettsia sennetsu str. Miyayama]